MYTLDLNPHLVRQNNIFVQQFIKLYICKNQPISKNQYQLTIEKKIFLFFIFLFLCFLSNQTKGLHYPKTPTNKQKGVAKLVDNQTRTYRISNI